MKPRPLRIAVLGDMESVHTQRWLRALAQRGHEVHAISYYPPEMEMAGVVQHSLRPPRPKTAGSAGASVARSRLPQSWLRPLHLLRYRRAGLEDVVSAIAPDVLHAHYVVEYGLYALASRFRPLVVSAWGSDVFRSQRQPLAKAIAGLVLRQADFVTASDAAMLAAVRRMGARRDASSLVRIGALEDGWFSDQPVSVNLTSDNEAPSIISTRAHEPLYGIDTVLRAFARVRGHVHGARLTLAHDGSLRSGLETLARELELGESVRFLGRLDAEALKDALSRSHVYVSVPLSDSMAASTMEAMARGCFPVVSDLPSQDGFIEHGVTGLRVTPGDVDTLAAALQRALVNPELRARAAVLNRQKVEEECRLSAQVDALEAAFSRVVGLRQ